MERFHLDATKSTPYIDFDPAKKVFIVSGESYPENSAAFFTPVFTWLSEFLSSSYEGPLVFDIELIYFNSSSSKAIMNFLSMLERASRAGKDITVNWRYYSDNDVALESGEEFKEDAPDLKFNVVEVERPRKDR